MSSFPWSQSHPLSLDFGPSDPVTLVHNDYCTECDSIFLFFSAPRQEYRDPLLAGFNLFLHSRLAVFSFPELFYFILFYFFCFSFTMVIWFLLFIPVVAVLPLSVLVGSPEYAFSIPLGWPFSQLWQVD